MSQIETVKNRIIEVGYADNFWAIDNYILRLGAIIHRLKLQDKMVFTGKFGKEMGKEKALWKNYYYVLEGIEYETEPPRRIAPQGIIKPEKIVELSEKDQQKLW